MPSIWTGAIAFGLVNIPVKLFSATEESSLDLDMLDSHDFQKIHYKRVNEKTGKEVPWKQIVKGYKYENRYVVLDDKDFERASPQQTREITLDFFCASGDIDPIYYETPYWAEPEKNGARAYLLLFTALKKSGKVAVGSFVLRNREHLCVLRPYGDLLLVQKIRYSAELRDPAAVTLPARSSVKPAELKMATALIDQLTNKFDISELKDSYTGKLMQFIKAKAKGKKMVTPPLRVAHKAGTDLMEQLKASIQPKRKHAS
jgi:DNA end-binding protein Ku